MIKVSNLLKKIGLRKKDKEVALSRSSFGTFGISFMLFLVSLFMAIPLLYTILQSIKPIEEYYIYPPRFFVINPTLDSYRAIISSIDSLGVPFTRYLFNAIFTTVVGTVSYLFLSLITAYPVAKSKIKIVAILNTFLVYAMLFHNDTMSMLRFVIMSYMGIIDTYWAVILPGFASTMGTYLIVQFIRANIHDEILEAARIDGAGEFKILFKIIAPSIKAGWLTALIFTFQSYWNQGASPYIYTEELKHISVAMNSIAASGITRAGTGMAVTLILMIPTVIIFLWNQRSIMNTMAHSGLK
jgi:ABC-type glycerol-3-phosphate transport system permease component